MKRVIRKNAVRMLRRAARATAYVAFASKLLVPVGYMPAALADGGPIRLCGMSLPASPMERGSRVAFVDDAANAASVLGHEHAHAAAAHVAHDVHSPHAAHGNPAVAIEHESHGDEHDPSSDHGPWERCALGGLAALAALAGDLTLTVDAARTSERASAMTPVWRSRAEIAIRARGPPPV